MNSYHQESHHQATRFCNTTKHRLRGEMVTSKRMSEWISDWKPQIGHYIICNLCKWPLYFNSLWHEDFGSWVAELFFPRMPVDSAENIFICHHTWNVIHKMLRKAHVMEKISLNWENTDNKSGTLQGDSKGKNQWKILIRTLVCCHFQKWS